MDKEKAISLNKLDILILNFFSCFKLKNKTGNVKWGPIPGSAIMDHFLRAIDYKSKTKK